MFNKVGSMKKRISTIMNWTEKSSPLRNGVNVMTYLHVILNTVCSSAAIRAPGYSASHGMVFIS